jgi:hypothetical protein
MQDQQVNHAENKLHLSLINTTNDKKKCEKNLPVS